MSKHCGRKGSCKGPGAEAEVREKGQLQGAGDGVEEGGSRARGWGRSRARGEQSEGLGPLGCSGKAAAAPGEMLLELIMALAAVPSPGGGCWQRKEITFTGIWNKCSSSGGNNSTHLPHNLPMYQHLPRVPLLVCPQTLPHCSPRCRTHALPSFPPSKLTRGSPSCLRKLACLFLRRERPVLCRAKV